MYFYGPWTFKRLQGEYDIVVSQKNRQKQDRPATTFLAGHSIHATTPKQDIATKEHTFK